MARIFCAIALATAGATPLLSSAGWSALGTSGGYLGNVALGVHRDSDSRNHRWMFSAGMTPDDRIGTVYQGNLAYLYSRGRFEATPHLTFRPFGVGVFVTYTNHDNYEIRRWSAAGTYAASAIHLGPMVASRAEFRLGERIASTGIFLSYLDQGVNQLWNNGHTEAADRYLSLGFSLGVELN